MTRGRGGLPTRKPAASPTRCSLRSSASAISSLAILSVATLGSMPEGPAGGSEGGKAVRASEAPAGTRAWSLPGPSALAASQRSPPPELRLPGGHPSPPSAPWWGPSPSPALASPPVLSGQPEAAPSSLPLQRGKTWPRSRQGEPDRVPPPGLNGTALWGQDRSSQVLSS